MNEQRMSVIWKGELVGFIENPKVDMFFLYGQWIPAGSSSMLQDFISLLKQNELLEVQIRGEDDDVIVATIDAEPSHDIEAKMHF